MVISSAVLEGVLITVGGAAALALVAGVWKVAKKLRGIPAKLDLFTDTLKHFIKVQAVHGDALTVSLICQRDGKCNGRVKDSIEALERAQKRTRAFMEAKAFGEDED